VPPIPVWVTPRDLLPSVSNRQHESSGPGIATELADLPFTGSFIVRHQQGLQTVTDFCNVLAASPNATPVGQFGAVAPGLTAVGNPYCHQATNWMGQTQIKMLGTYQVPKANVTFAATLQSVPGPVVAANYTAANVLVQPSLGRPLSGGQPNKGNGPSLLRPLARGQHRILAHGAKVRRQPIANIDSSVLRHFRCRRSRH